MDVFYENRPIIHKDFSEEYRRVLLNELDAESTYEEASKSTAKLVIFAQAAFNCYMIIYDRFLGDDGILDLFIEYSEISEMYSIQRNNEIILRSNGETILSTSILPMLAEKKERIRDRALRIT